MDQHHNDHLDVGTTADPTPGYCKYYVKDGDDTYLPCGLMANSMFNDTFKLMNPDLEMREDQIAWEVDRTFRFRNPDGYPEICDDNYLCLYELYPGIISREDGFKDEHFMVWMRAAALDTFMNKYGRIDQDLKKGDTLTFEVTARFVVEPFNGGKALIVTTNSWIGGKWGKYNYIIEFLLLFSISYPSSSTTLLPCSLPPLLH
mmetsp:Transcript_9301/g.17812  ORF Transcript_9301/g.17812 Transcript_9301/m.17812 type:complete len:203 (-) Transcript_9301:888-1496(-)